MLIAALLLGCGGRSSQQRGSNDDESKGAGAASSSSGQGGTFGEGAAGTTAPRGGCGPARAAAAGAGGHGAPVDCGAGERTRITGVVRDPAGRVPIHSALVFVPSDSLPGIVEGPSCDDPCAAPISPLAGGITDLNGRFDLEAPAGLDVPLVIQIGKWRRELVLPEVTACAENRIEPELTRLPRNRAEGWLPRLAVTTGLADSVECFLRRVGIADEEFTTPDRPGRVHVFAGCDAPAPPSSGGFTVALGDADFPPASALWQDPSALARYDAVLLGCDGEVCDADKTEHAQNVADYANQGGRLFLSHSQSVWLRTPPPWPLVMTPIEPALTGPAELEAQVDVTSPKGDAFADWLVQTGASALKGKVLLHDPHFSFSAVDPRVARQWVYADAAGDPAGASGVVVFSMLTPVGAPEDQVCGRVTFTGFHVASVAQLDAPGRFPDGCVEGDLSPQELALEFLLFDRSACIGGGPIAPRPPTEPTPPCP